MIYPRSVRASQGRQQQQTLFLVIEKIGGGSSSSSNILWTFYDKTKPVEMDLLECNNRGTPFKRLWFRGCRDGVDSWEAGVGGWGKARPHHSQNKKKKVSSSILFTLKTQQQGKKDYCRQVWRATDLGSVCIPSAIGMVCFVIAVHMACWATSQQLLAAKCVNRL